MSMISVRCSSHSGSRGELPAFQLTPGNVGDRVPVFQLKNISQIEHSRHRHPINFLVSLLAGLIAYRHQPKKRLLNLAPHSVQAPTVIPN